VVPKGPSVTIARPTGVGSARTLEGQRAARVTPARAATRKLEQFSSTTVLETATATDCRYLDYNSNPAISAEVAAERGERNPHKAPETN
jgi:hypothetical protein